MAEPLDPSKLIAQTVDGMAVEPSIISYTEQVLAAKEATLRKYIEENYTKIQNVEKELRSLTLEVKLTSGSKKAALELLRKKIEQSSEKLKIARGKEQAAKAAWEAARKVVADEELAKAKLCTDLNLMVQESAMQQYSKLEELTRKLDALNPALAGGAMQALEGLRAKIAPHGAPVLASANQEAGPDATSASTQGGATGDPAAPKPESNPAKSDPPEAIVSQDPVQSGASNGTEGTHQGPRGKGEKEIVERKGGAQGGGRGRGRGRGSRGRGGSMLLKAGSSGNQWTGAGFDVEDGEGPH